MPTVPRQRQLQQREDTATLVNSKLENPAQSVCMLSHHLKQKIFRKRQRTKLQQNRQKSAPHLLVITPKRNLFL